MTDEMTDEQLADMHRLLAEFHRRLASEAALDVVQQYHSDLAQRLTDEAALIPRRTAIVQRLHEREQQEFKNASNKKRRWRVNSAFALSAFALRATADRPPTPLHQHQPRNTALPLGGITNLDYTILLCSKMDETRAFYRDVMKFPVETDQPNWCSFRVGAALLTLRPRGWTPFRGRQVGAGIGVGATRLPRSAAGGRCVSRRAGGEGCADPAGADRPAGLAASHAVLSRPGGQSDRDLCGVLRRGLAYLRLVIPGRDAARAMVRNCAPENPYSGRSLCSQTEQRLS